jgi:hypothetical protein
VKPAAYHTQNLLVCQSTLPATLSVRVVMLLYIEQVVFDVNNISNCICTTITTPHKPFVGRGCTSAKPFPQLPAGDAQ